MLIELSYIISLDMPKWPTNPAERIEYNTVIQNGDPSNASSVFHHLHTGTHVMHRFILMLMEKQSTRFR